MTLANVGTADRLARIILGLALIALPFILSSIAVTGMTGIAMIAVGAILTVTALIKFCPIYRVFGLRTSPKTDD